MSTGWLEHVPFETVWQEKKTILMRKTDTFASMTDKVRTEFKIHEGTIRFFHNGRELDGDLTLSKTPWSKGSIIVVYVEKEPAKPPGEPDSAKVDQLVELGFDRALCQKALSQNEMDVERSLNWLLEHASQAPPPPPPKKDSEALKRRQELLDLAKKRNIDDAEKLIDEVCSGDLEAARQLIQSLT